MPPTGFHGLLGLILASKLDQKRENTKIGLVFGSVMPDLDLLGSVLLFILTNNKELTLAFHRSVSHSIVIITIILLINYLVTFFSDSAKSSYFPFILGLIIGMLIHVALDMFYFEGVTLFWPLQAFGERVRLIQFTYKDLTPAFNSLEAKVIGTLDGHFELIFYLVFVFLANKYQTDQRLTIGYRSKNLLIDEWPKKLKIFSYFLIVELIFFLGLALVSISLPFLDLDTFIILLYIPLTPVYLLSGFLPLLMRETVVHLGEESIK